MLENQLLEEFRLRLVGDTESALEARGDKPSLAADVALAEVVLGDLEEALPSTISASFRTKPGGGGAK